MLEVFVSIFILLVFRWICWCFVSSYLTLASYCVVLFFFTWSLYYWLFHSQIKSVASLESSLQAMKGQADALKEELGTELQSQLSVEDQRQVDFLNDQINRLTQENRQAWQERIRVRLWSSTEILILCFLSEQLRYILFFLLLCNFV